MKPISTLFSVLKTRSTYDASAESAPVPAICAIGVLATSIDLLTLRWLLAHNSNRFIAVTVAYALSVAVHFTLNKYLSFRNFERDIHRQLPRYFLVIAGSYVLTVGCVEIGVRLFALNAMVSKVFSIAFVFPLSFLAHRSFTFDRRLRSDAQPEDPI